MPESSTISLTEGRFARFEAIRWWEQSLLKGARVLIVGAGALGNEVIKNLSLLGVGHLLIADMDRIETSNLCRSVLFRDGDEGQPKATVAARAAETLYPQLRATPLVGNILSDVGLGYFRWAQVVVGALDNREARVFVNRACAQVHRPWIDGGIDVLSGIVRGFEAPETACYECTMGQADWDLLAKRRSCSLLARQASVEGGTPTTPTTASIIGAIQAQEVVKRLHGMEALSGQGYVFEGLTHNSYQVAYPISPDCPWHESPTPIETMSTWSSETLLRDVWAWGVDRFGGLDAIDLSRELVERLDCPSCGQSQQVMQSIERISEDQAVCESCGGEYIPQFLHSLDGESVLLDMSIGDLGLPAWDIVWVRRGAEAVGVEFSADRSNGLATTPPGPTEEQTGGA
ncbi:MAG: ThiF family adenylyltransferase [Phycisphaerae bacterium]|jgi:adenylyltransferase/sulfurtransferase|nr:ThiF family adenylyltransferase [Phycisphaerae bacterium]